MIGERRKKQIESLLLRAIQERLARGFNDPRIRGLVTATRVEAANDMKRVKVFVSVMPEEHASLTLHGLRAAHKKLRRDVADKVHLKDMPELDIVYDEGLKQQMEVMSLLTRDKIERGESLDTPTDASAGSPEDQANSAHDAGESLP